MKYELPKLPYSYDALEPYIDAKTMEIHHTKHHQAYINKLNEALEKYPEIAEKSLVSLLTDLSTVPEDIRKAVQNHGGGHYNHSMFWEIMAPNGGGMLARNGLQSEVGGPSGKLEEAINLSFGDFKTFQEEFNKIAGAHFGSGWVWLVMDNQQHNKLKIVSLPNQDNPLSQGLKPIMGLDIWEHAYYLKYQNRRPEYVDAFFHVINWDRVNENYLKSR